MQVHLEWNFNLNCDLTKKPVFSVNKSPFEMEFSLDCGLVTELIFRDFFSINKNVFEMEF